MSMYNNEQILERISEHLQLVPIFNDPANIHYGKHWLSSCNLESFLIAIEPLCYDVISADSAKIISWLKEVQMIQISTEDNKSLVYFNENHPLLSSACLLSACHESIEQIIMRRVFTWLTCSNDIDLSMTYTVEDILSHLERVATVRVPVYSLAIIKKLEENNLILVSDSKVSYCTISTYPKRKDFCNSGENSSNINCKRPAVNTM
jgi:hypothetical protein